MGGISTSSLVLTSEGHGQFLGHVSLENYGGFASIQLNKSIDLSSEDKLYSMLKIRLFDGLFRCSDNILRNISKNFL